MVTGAVAQTQQAKKIPRIGYLMLAETPRETTRFEGIRLALRELGYINGQNITIEYRSGKEKPDRVPELAVELARLKVDIIVAEQGPVSGRPRMRPRQFRS